MECSDCCPLHRQDWCNPFLFLQHMVSWTAMEPSNLFERHPIQWGMKKNLQTACLERVLFVLFSQNHSAIECCCLGRLTGFDKRKRTSQNKAWCCTGVRMIFIEKFIIRLVEVHTKSITGQSFYSPKGHPSSKRKWTKISLLLQSHFLKDQWYRCARGTRNLCSIPSLTHVVCLQRLLVVCY